MKTNEDQISIIMQSEGLRLMSPYKGVLQPLLYLCKCKRINKTTWHDFSRGTRCGYCGKHRCHKYSQEEVASVFLEHKCELLSVYKTINEKIRYKCSCGNESETTFKAFKRGNKKCPVCTQIRGEKTYNWIQNREELKQRKKFRDKIHYLLGNSLSRLSLKKLQKTNITLGYSTKELKERIESHPNWVNVKDKTWHLDHIFPVKAFLDFKIYEIKLVNHLDNLQPLLASENLVKGDKYDITEFKNWLKTKFSVLV